MQVTEILGSNSFGNIPFDISTMYFCPGISVLVCTLQYHLSIHFDIHKNLHIL